MDKQALNSEIFQFAEPITKIVYLDWDSTEYLSGFSWG
jgi:hypothetical protein